MLAADTNVVVRYLVNEDAAQHARARRVIDSGEVWVTTTVLIETDWVLRASYGQSRAEAVKSLRDFAGLPTVSLEAPAVAAQALSWAEQGMDLADAIHLAASAHCEAFVTFDRGLVRAAKRLGLSARAP